MPVILAMRSARLATIGAATALQTPSDIFLAVISAGRSPRCSCAVPRQTEDDHYEGDNTKNHLVRDVKYSMPWFPDRMTTSYHRCARDAG